MSQVEEAHTGGRLLHRNGDEVGGDVGDKDVLDEAAGGFPVLAGLDRPSESRAMWNKQPRNLCPHPDSGSLWLCVSGQLPRPLWALLSSFYLFF